jgi:proline dehydrogenase
VFFLFNFSANHHPSPAMMRAPATMRHTRTGIFAAAAPGRTLRSAYSSLAAGIHEDTRLHGLFPSKAPVPLTQALTAEMEASAATSSSSSHASEMAAGFGDAKTAFASKSTFELLRTVGVFQTCRIGPIVKYCDTLYDVGLKTVGPTIVHGILRHTMFNHFCAGETSKEIIPRMNELRKLGVGGILDYAAEAKDDSVNKAAAANTPIGVSGSIGSLGSLSPSEVEETIGAPLSSRKYDYQGEAVCDANTDIFLEAVAAVKDATPDGFAAIKLSGLGNPVLLERMSRCLVELTWLFRAMADGVAQSTGPHDPFYAAERSFKLDFATFREGWKRSFSDKTSEQELREKFEQIDRDQDGLINFSEWADNVRLSEINELVRHCKDKGPLYQAALDEEEVELYMNIIGRVVKIMDLARELGVRVMVDAEWVDIQPAIDHIVLFLQRTYNRGDKPIVFQTYQTYLKGMDASVSRDLERSAAEGWRFGAKVVRGAYMVSEREKARNRLEESPVNETYEETEANFHRVIDSILSHNVSRPAGLRPGVAASWVWPNAPSPFVSPSRKAPAGQGKAAQAEVLVASHNRDSVEYTVKRMEELGKDREKVYFGQLLGMADHLTNTLGAHGYKAYKYVPYGPIDEVVPYLIRRTQENSAILGSAGVQEERGMVTAELRRRMGIPF